MIRVFGLRNIKELSTKLIPPPYVPLLPLNVIFPSNVLVVPDIAIAIVWTAFIEVAVNESYI